MSIVRNFQNNMLYRYLGNDVYRNIHTGKEGVVPPEAAKNIFKINVEASSICNEYPLVEELIKKLDLKIDINNKP